jgi:hypothetical protein
MTAGRAVTVTAGVGFSSRVDCRDGIACASGTARCSGWSKRERGEPFAGGCGGSMTLSGVPRGREGRTIMVMGICPRWLPEPAVKARRIGLRPNLRGCPRGVLLIFCGWSVKGAGKCGMAARWTGCGCVSAVIPAGGLIIFVLTLCGVGSLPCVVPTGGEGGKTSAPGTVCPVPGGAGGSSVGSCNWFPLSLYPSLRVFCPLSAGSSLLIPSPPSPARTFKPPSASCPPASATCAPCCCPAA